MYYKMKKSVLLRTFLLRGVAQLVARYVRDVEAASSSLVTPTGCKVSKKDYLCT